MADLSPYTRVLIAVSLISVFGCAAQPSQSDLEVRLASVQVGDMMQHYRIMGEGPPLLLIHGLTETWRVWQPQIDALSKKHQLIIPDLRGHGETSNPDSSVAPIQVAHDLLALLAVSIHAP